MKIVGFAVAAAACAMCAGSASAADPVLLGSFTGNISGGLVPGITPIGLYFDLRTGPCLGPPNTCGLPTNPGSALFTNTVFAFTQLLPSAVSQTIAVDASSPGFAEFAAIIESPSTPSVTYLHYCTTTTAAPICTPYAQVAPPIAGSFEFPNASITSLVVIWSAFSWGALPGAGPGAGSFPVQPDGSLLSVTVQAYGHEGFGAPPPVPQYPQDPSVPLPEPSTWAIMIGGFGLVGVALRRRRPAIR